MVHRWIVVSVGRRQVVQQRQAKWLQQGEGMSKRLTLLKRTEQQ